MAPVFKKPSWLTESYRGHVDVEMVRDVLDYLYSCADDPEAEAAHTVTEALQEAVLRAIADGRCVDPAACALAAIAGFPD